MAKSKKDKEVKELTPEQEAELRELINQQEVDRGEEYKTFSQNLQKSLFWFTEDNVFIGGMLQEMNFRPDYRLPTAALAYDKNKQEFQVLINPTFFNKMTLDHQMGVLHHEILHFTNAHLWRFNLEKMAGDEHKRFNIAADMSINQYIKELPKGCVDVKYYEQEDGTPFPVYATAEVYYDLLKDNPNAQDKAKQKMKEDGIEMGEGDGVLDEHNWETMSEEEKQQMAQEMKKVVKRTMEKTSYDKSRLPGAIKDLIEEIDSFLTKFNYKQILQQAIKKTVSFADRTSTWKKPNKRYGVVAQGTTMSKLPHLSIYIDTSGSISVKEMNEFLQVVNGFLKAGTRSCSLGFWHTKLYKKRKYKLNTQLKQDEIESGGTDMTETCVDINKSVPDLSIILTDGYFDTDVIPKSETIIIVSENGTLDHPLKNKARNIKTIGMKGLK